MAFNFIKGSLKVVKMLVLSVYRKRITVRIFNPVVLKSLLATSHCVKMQFMVCRNANCSLHVNV